ncbi:MAG: hypothetical protein PHG97_07200 [Candidatus Margulisbacteria bacterium]|nr:hypothetical protein [Candidatus Margulisiibacteriota bacterium]
MRNLFLAVVFCLLALPAMAFELGGYYENDLLGLLKKDGGFGAGDLNRFRLKLDQKFGEALTLHLEPRYYYLAKSQTIPLAGVTGLDQLTWDRVYLKYYSRSVNLTVGKQRIAWGSGTIWNPTDAFNPFVLSFAVKEEETTNVQALRLEVPVGAAGGLDAFVLTDAPWRQTKKGVRAKTTAGLFDLALSYVDLGSDSFQVGFDSSGDVYQAGVRNEIVLKAPAGSNGYIQSVWGGDYTLDNGIGLNLEYFFNGLGKKNQANYDWAGLSAGNINQLGMDYLFFSANSIIDEITQVRCSVLTNLDDLSWLIYPSYTRNIEQNVDLAVEAMLTGGQPGSEYNPSAAQDPNGLGGSKLALIRMIFSF